MTDHWADWTADGPDVDGHDVGETVPDELGDGQPDYLGEAVEEFGPGEADISDGELPGGEESIDGEASDAGGEPPPLGYADIHHAARVDELAEPDLDADPHLPGDADPELHLEPDSGADPDPPAEAGMGHAGDSTPPAEVGFGAAGSTPIGADPDVDPYRDAEPWPEPAFPEPVALGPLPEPVDGFPWTDPTTLGSAAAEPYTDAGLRQPAPAELANYAGEDLPAETDPWSRLAASDDPATSALARFWSPPGPS